MEQWSQALRFALFELKASKWKFIFVVIFSIFMGFSFVFSMPEYLKRPFFISDILLILLFSVMTIWLRASVFQSKGKGENYYSPTVVLLKQLPITSSVIAKSRFIVYFAYAIPMQSIILITMYLFTPAMQDVLSIESFITFCIIWFAFGVYVGGIFTASDAGTNEASPMKTFIYIACMILIGAIILYLIYAVFNTGIIMLTIKLANNWPLLSIIISVLLAVIGYFCWYNEMKKMLRNTDYY